MKATLFSTDQPFVLLERRDDNTTLVRTFGCRADLVKALSSPGVCNLCGCTDDHACDGGCAWVDDEHTICTRCVERSLQLALANESKEAA